MTKKIIEGNIFNTELVNTGDYIRIKQLDKITGIEHKIILDRQELLIIADMFKNKDIKYL